MSKQTPTTLDQPVPTIPDGKPTTAKRESVDWEFIAGRYKKDKKFYDVETSMAWCTKTFEKVELRKGSLAHAKSQLYNLCLAIGSIVFFVRLDIPITYVNRYLPLNEIQNIVSIPDFENPSKFREMVEEKRIIRHRNRM